MSAPSKSARLADIEELSGALGGVDLQIELKAPSKSFLTFVSSNAFRIVEIVLDPLVDPTEPFLQQAMQVLTAESHEIRVILHNEENILGKLLEFPKTCDKTNSLVRGRYCKILEQLVIRSEMNYFKNLENYSEFLELLVQNVKYLSFYDFLANLVSTKSFRIISLMEDSMFTNILFSALKESDKYQDFYARLLGYLVRSLPQNSSLLSPLFLHENIDLLMKIGIENKSRDAATAAFEILLEIYSIYSENNPDVKLYIESNIDKVFDFILQSKKFTMVCRAAMLLVISICQEYFEEEEEDFNQTEETIEDTGETESSPFELINDELDNIVINANRMMTKTESDANITEKINIRKKRRSLSNDCLLIEIADNDESDQSYEEDNYSADEGMYSSNDPEPEKIQPITKIAPPIPLPPHINEIQSTPLIVHTNKNMSPKTKSVFEPSSHGLQSASPLSDLLKQVKLDTHYSLPTFPSLPVLAKSSEGILERCFSIAEDPLEESTESNSKEKESQILESQHKDSTSIIEPFKYLCVYLINQAFVQRENSFIQVSLMELIPLLFLNHKLVEEVIDQTHMISKILEVPKDHIFSCCFGFLHEIMILMNDYEVKIPSFYRAKWEEYLVNTLDPKEKILISSYGGDLPQEPPACHFTEETRHILNAD